MINQVYSAYFYNGRFQLVDLVLSINVLVQ